MYLICYIYCELCAISRIKEDFKGNFQTFPKQQILDSSKLKGYADDNFRFHENGRECCKRVENTVEKG